MFRQKFWLCVTADHCNGNIVLGLGSHQRRQILQNSWFYSKCIHHVCRGIYRQIALGMWKKRLKWVLRELISIAWTDVTIAWVYLWCCTCLKFGIRASSMGTNVVSSNETTKREELNEKRLSIRFIVSCILLFHSRTQTSNRISFGKLNKGSSSSIMKKKKNKLLHHSEKHQRSRVHWLIVENRVNMSDTKITHKGHFITLNSADALKFCTARKFDLGALMRRYLSMSVYACMSI